jgi:hypothetical protein
MENVSPKSVAATTHQSKKESSIMPIKTEIYVRKPFEVEAVQVTKENQAEVALWCEGVIEGDEVAKNFIKVDVPLARYIRQTQAYVGDWVLKTTTGFRVYTSHAFVKAFEVESEQVLLPFTD